MWHFFGRQFECFIATTADEEHAELFLRAMDKLDPKAKHIEHFKSKDGQFSRLRHFRGKKSLTSVSGAFEACVCMCMSLPNHPHPRALGTSSACDKWLLSMLDERTGTSSFTSLIVDDCQRLKGQGWEDDQNTWLREDRNNVFPITPYDPFAHFEEVSPTCLFHSDPITSLAPTECPDTCRGAQGLPLVLHIYSVRGVSRATSLTGCRG